MPFTSYNQFMRKSAVAVLTPEAMQAAMQPPPQDPGMMGGQPPMDPSMMGGQPPMDPAAMGGAPEEQPMDPMMQELASLMTTVVGDEVVTPLKEAIEAIGKQMNDLKELVKTMRDEMDVVRDQVDSQEHTDDKRKEEDKDEEQKLRDELAADLQPTVPQEPEVKTAAAQPVQPAEQWRPVNIMDVLGRK